LQIDGPRLNWTTQAVANTLAVREATRFRGRSVTLCLAAPLLASRQLCRDNLG
jgi:hypothetical protein